jgi:glutamine amidotransferase
MSAPAVTVVDLGLGNLHSVVKAFERAGAIADLSSDPEVLLRADRLVMPGQGAFKECAHALAGEVGDAVRAWIGRGKPYLGICLGMQALFDSSEEAPGEKGLGFFSGTVKRFAPDLADAQGRPLKIPHIGWNQIASRHPVFEDGEWYYFVHSYCCVPDDESLVAATTEYGGPFCSAIARDNVLACQFHPEKSQHAGARLIRRFLGEASWS